MEKSCIKTKMVLDSFVVLVVNGEDEGCVEILVALVDEHLDAFELKDILENLDPNVMHRTLMQDRVARRKYYFHENMNM